jgi:hypothetical protein
MAWSELILHFQFLLLNKRNCAYVGRKESHRDELSSCMPSSCSHMINILIEQKRHTVRLGFRLWRNKHVKTLGGKPVLEEVCWVHDLLQSSVTSEPLPQRSPSTADNQIMSVLFLEKAIPQRISLWHHAQQQRVHSWSQDSRVSKNRTHDFSSAACMPQNDNWYKPCSTITHCSPCHSHFHRKVSTVWNYSRMGFERRPDRCIGAFI